MMLSPLFSEIQIVLCCEKCFAKREVTTGSTGFFGCQVCGNMVMRVYAGNVYNINYSHTKGMCLNCGSFHLMGVPIELIKELDELRKENILHGKEEETEGQKET